MSAADCRSGKCSCAAISGKMGEADQTVMQTVQYGWLNDDGSYSWGSCGSGCTHDRRVTPAWAAHLHNRTTGQLEGRWLIAEADGWLIYRYCAEVPEAVARIRWEPAEAVNRG